MSRTRWVLVCVAALLVALGLVVRFVGDPVLLRFPLDTDQNLQYRGSISVEMNPTTMVPLASPIRLPLTVSRTVRVKSGSYSQAVIDETIAMTFAGSTRTERYQYVMDRRTMQLRDSPLSYAFGNPHDVMKSISGSYRIDLPMGTSSSLRYSVWAPEIDAGVVAVPTGPAHHAAVPNTQVVSFDTNFQHRVAPYYLAYLERGGLPVKLSSTSIATELKAHGASTAAVLRAVAPYVTSNELKALQVRVAGLSIPLVYSYFQQGQFSVQQSTGALVDAKSTREGVSVAPDLSSLHRLTAALAPLRQLSAVRQLDAAVAAMTGTRAVFDLSYAQTSSSVRAVTAKANRLASMIELVKWQLPLVLVVLGAVVLLMALLWRRPRRSAQVAELPLAPSGEPSPAEQAGRAERSA